ncbi:MAG: hypothetical protein AB1656_24250 [Candidatus Omnitrophota bacterium]
MKNLSLNPIFSLPAPGGAREALDFRRIAEWRKSLFPETAETLLELTANRAGLSGFLPDNPPIDLLDELMEKAEKNRCRFVSLFIPITLNQTGEKLEEEISIVNGWTDLAAYMGIPLARLRLAEMSSDSFPSAQNALSQIVNYLSDADIVASLSIPDLPIAQLLDFVEKHRDKEHPLLGCDWELETEPQQPLAECGIPSAMTASIHICFAQRPNREDLEQRLREIESHFAEAPPPVILSFNVE